MLYILPVNTPSNIMRKTLKPRSLDRIDCGIIEALQNDARSSNKELAALVGLSPSSCLERVRKLKADGVLRGAHTDVDPKALGIGIQAMMTIRLVRHTRENFQAFRCHLMELDEVVAVYRVAGADDFHVHVAVRDADHLSDLVLDGIASRDELAHLETALMFHYERKPGLPIYVEPED